jgi:hypothetical protein
MWWSPAGWSGLCHDHMVTKASSPGGRHESRSASGRRLAARDYMSSIPRERRRRVRRRVLRNLAVDAADQTLATRWCEEHWRKTRYGLFYFGIGLFAALTTLFSVGLNTVTIFVWALLPFLVAINLVGLSFGFLGRRWLRDHESVTS